MAPTRGAAFAAAVRVIHWVHYHAAHFGASSQPAGAARLAQANIGMIAVAYFADGRAAGNGDAAHFSRRQAQYGKFVLAGK